MLLHAIENFGKLKIKENCRKEKKNKEKICLL